MAVQIQVDQKRLRKTATVDQIISMQEGSLKAMRDVLGNFVLGPEGEYLPQEEGIKVLGGLTLDELNEAANAFLKKAEDAAVPPQNGAD